jgi:hypothetical protein
VEVGVGLAGGSIVPPSVGDVGELDTGNVLVRVEEGPGRSRFVDRAAPSPEPHAHRNEAPTTTAASSLRRPVRASEPNGFLTRR